MLSGGVSCNWRCLRVKLGASFFSREYGVPGFRFRHATTYKVFLGFRRQSSRTMGLISALSEYEAVYRRIKVAWSVTRCKGRTFRESAVLYTHVNVRSEGSSGLSDSRHSSVPGAIRTRHFPVPVRCCTAAVTGLAMPLNTYVLSILLAFLAVATLRFIKSKCAHLTL
jgi:hypothetical protein